MAPLRFHTVDAFTSQPFCGNPAAVIVFDEGDSRAHDDSLLQHVAAEFNLSETAFCTPLTQSQDADYLIRWITPTTGQSPLAADRLSAHPATPTLTSARDGPTVLPMSRRGTTRESKWPDVYSRPETFS